MRTHDEKRTNAPTSARERTNERTTDGTANKSTHERTNEPHESHAKIAPGTGPRRSLDDPGEPKIEEKSLRSALGAILGDPGSLGALLGRSGSALGRARDGPRTLPGRPRDDIGRSQEAPGRPQDASESAWSEFFARPWRKSLPKGSQSDFRAILRRSCLVARQRRCARYISFSGSEAQSQHVRRARAHARMSIEKTGVSASKIEPGGSKTSKVECQNGPVERKSALAVPPGPPKI